MKEKIKKITGKGWFKFLMSYIGLYLILSSIILILFELQTPDLLRFYTQEELNAYQNTALLSLQVERQNSFLYSYLPFIAFVFNIGIWLIVFGIRRDKT